MGSLVFCSSEVCFLCPYESSGQYYVAVPPKNEIKPAPFKCYFYMFCLTVLNINLHVLVPVMISISFLVVLVAESLATFYIFLNLPFYIYN
jgi:hypothetical protein